MLNPLGNDSPARMWAIISTSRGVRTWRILAQVIKMIFAAPRSVPNMTYTAHVVAGVWCGEVSVCDARVCTVCV